MSSMIVISALRSTRTSSILSLTVFVVCVLFILLPDTVFAAKYVPKWKKQACEVPASQNEQSHYTCDDNGEVKCLPGWQGDLCDVPTCRKGCDPLQGYCKRPGECRCKLDVKVPVTRGEVDQYEQRQLDTNSSNCLWYE